MAPIPKPKRDRTKHYFREWREYRHLTQEQAMGRLGWSQSKISRLENGDTPYNQDDLEAAAEAYQCTKTQLIEMNPYKDGEVVDLLAMLRSASDAERRAMIAFFSTLRSGTDG